MIKYILVLLLLLFPVSAQAKTLFFLSNSASVYPFPQICTNVGGNCRNNGSGVWNNIINDTFPGYTTAILEKYYESDGCLGGANDPDAYPNTNPFDWMRCADDSYVTSAAMPEAASMKSIADCISGGAATYSRKRRLLDAAVTAGDVVVVDMALSMNLHGLNVADSADVYEKMITYIKTNLGCDVIFVVHYYIAGITSQFGFQSPYSNYSDIASCAVTYNEAKSGGNCTNANVAMIEMLDGSGGLINWLAGQGVYIIRIDKWIENNYPGGWTAWATHCLNCEAAAGGRAHFGTTNYNDCVPPYAAQMETSILKGLYYLGSQ